MPPHCRYALNHLCVNFLRLDATHCIFDNRRDCCPYEWARLRRATEVYVLREYLMSLIITCLLM